MGSLQLGGEVRAHAAEIFQGQIFGRNPKN
nr:MAG TPA: hypothetical protein [Caudoviricetes sp.]